MMLKAYAVFDRKALIYNPPFFAVSDGAAVRSFGDVANDMDTSIGRHPTDYVLFEVGIYDDSNGLLEPTAPLRHVSDAIQLVRVQSPIFQETK